MRNITRFMIAAALVVSGPAFAQENEVANAPADVTATDPLAAPDANAVVDPLATNDMGAVPVTDPAADPLAADPMYDETAPAEDDDDGFPWGVLGLLGLLGLIPRNRRNATTDR